MITEKRDLRTGKPIWLARALPRLKHITRLVPLKPDAVVVGTGVSGALMADALLNAGFTVLAVDRRSPMSGSTPASTALIQSELDMPLTELQRKIGKSDAARTWLRSAQAVQSLADRIADLNINCDFVARTTLYLPGNILDVSDLKVESRERAKIAFRSNFVGKSEIQALSGLSQPGAIYTQGNGELDPVKLVAGLWRSFIKRGGTMVSNCEINEIDEMRNGLKLTTNDGPTIQCKQAVFCTGYERLTFFKPKGFKVISTWVLATKPQKKVLWPSKSLIWQAADPYLYLRTTRDGRIIVGGEDEPFSDDEKRDAMIGAKVQAIARKAKRLFPLVDFTPDFQWSGSFGESPNGLPVIGLIPRYKRCYTVMGFGGNGITFSILAAQLVSRHIQGIADADNELFKPID